MRKKLLYIIFFLALPFFNLLAQRNKQSAIICNYSYQIPYGSVAELFGNNSSVGTKFFLEKKNNYFYGLEVNYLFGSDIKDTNIFENISTSNGAIIASDGYYANVNLMQRGFNSYLFLGKAFHFSKKSLSGIYISQGLGFLQYKLFIDTKNQDIPQLNEEMKKGYDRLTNGISSKFSIDYKYYSKNGRFQLISGIHYTIAHTKHQRAYDFANNLQYTEIKRWDKFLGFDIGIIIPISRRNKEEFHYY